MNSEERATKAIKVSHIGPLPLALYESNGIIFELYQGGGSLKEQPVIRWERVQTLTVTRDGELTFHVRVRQANSASQHQPQ